MNPVVNAPMLNHYHIGIRKYQKNVNHQISTQKLEKKLPFN